jgi:hypothetical protein
VPVLMVLSKEEAHGLFPGGLQIGNCPHDEVGPVFGRSEQGFGKGIVIAHPRAGVGRRDAEPVQHGQHGGRPHGGAVVAVQHRPGGPGMRTLGRGGSPG